ncbi:MAG: phage head closure protein [Caldilineales bacterium]|jgi:phage head-tail adaptor, putative, SPP1 family|nr:phage head closure protein [Caldilineales bacterium]
MQAGRLRHRLAIRQPTISRNEVGEEIITWATLATVWGRIEALRGEEQLAAKQLTAEIVARATLRYRADVSTDMRIQYDSSEYDIDAVLADPLKTSLTLTLTAPAP